MHNDLTKLINAIKLATCSTFAYNYGEYNAITKYLITFVHKKHEY